jgi:hypothetical protein
MDETTLTQLKNAITSLADRVNGVNVRAYESMPKELLASELQPVAADLLAAASKLVADVLQAYETHNGAGRPADVSGALESPYVRFEQAIDAAVDAQAASSLTAVGDIAFLAQLELRQRAERLERVTAAKSSTAIVSECDSALRRIRKVLTSIDVALARAGLVPPTLDFESELQESLRVRRAYAKLRARVFAAGDPTPASLHVRLRGAGTAIAMLVGWEVYPSLRVRDRLQLRDLQRRILDWLRDERDTTCGMQLWQDLVAFIGMLSQINRRQELLAHDAAVVQLGLSRLDASGGTLQEDDVRALAALEGLDEEVDALLASPQRTAAEAWRAPLERLARQLRGSEGSA